MASTEAHTWQSGFKKREVGPGSRGPAAQPPKCPECASTRVWKDGLRRYGHSTPLHSHLKTSVQFTAQRWLCRGCGYRFSGGPATVGKKMNDAMGGKEVVRKDSRNVTEGSTRNSRDSAQEPSFINHKNRELHNLGRQVCVTETEAKNLVTVETQGIGQREATEFFWHLRKMGYEISTAKGYAAIIKMLHKKGIDLSDPERVKLFMAQQCWNLGRKANVIKAYSAFLRMQGLECDKQRCNPKKGLPRPPTTEQVKQIIAASTRKFAMIYKFMSETGPSPIEVEIMTEKNFNFENNRVYIEGRKGHLDRIVPLSNELIALMKTYLAKYKCFPKSWKLSKKFRQIRNGLAAKLNDPSFKNIRLYDLRHYFGTMVYAKTKDILYVKDLMGHSKIETTMIYTKLVVFPQEEEFICKIAKTIQEASELVEAGFDYVTDMDDRKLFRKRKALYGGPWSSEKGPWSSSD